jgi:actin-related protein 6
MKESSCYLVENNDQFKRDLLTCKKQPRHNELLKEYVLPDGKSVKRGFVLDRSTTTPAESASIVNLTNERFQIPEVLFRPFDIGINEGGIAQMIKQISSQRVPKAMENLMLQNIIVGGGNSLFEGFSSRLKNELECGGLLTDQIDSVKIYETETKDAPFCNGAWRGLKSFS